MDKASREKFQLETGGIFKSGFTDGKSQFQVRFGVDFRGFSPL